MEDEGQPIRLMERQEPAGEKRAGLVAALSIMGGHGARTLTVFRRRRGLLSAPAVKFLGELRKLAANRRR